MLSFFLDTNAKSNIIPVYFDLASFQPQFWEHLLVAFFLLFWIFLSVGMIMYVVIRDAITISFSKDNGIFREVRMFPRVLLVGFLAFKSIIKALSRLWW